ncbi:Gcp-like domain-containing protein, partial [Kockiozyma suomiensis]|uniref:Gcp-like domain-containing protein n=1 Tax=Kockiozyma suomiensis TaxID=1337062 RepID=UPI0033438B8E
RRTYLVLGIETSCDDTSVCLYDRFSASAPPRLLVSLKESTDNSDTQGIVPMTALMHHQSHLASLVSQALRPSADSAIPLRPDLICVTRGPGMRGSLSAGTEFAKGLAVALRVPLIGVHHMLGHLLTPRLLANPSPERSGPAFPYLSLLASGGHTMLVLSRSLVDHEILANTIDIAIGDAIDKCARAIGLQLSNNNSYGPELERAACLYLDLVKSGQIDNEATKSIEIPIPMRNKNRRTDATAFSFAAYISILEREVTKTFGGFNNLSNDERLKLAKRIQDAIFLQTVERIVFTVNNKLDEQTRSQIKDFVCAGGVASNMALRTALREALKRNDSWRMHFPPLNLCTDNGEMIAWAGIELWEKMGLRSSLDMLPLSKWPLE